MDVLHAECALGQPPAGWQAEIACLLDEHHLSAWSADSSKRANFAAGLGAFLAGLDDAQVIPIYGRSTPDLGGLCYQLERSIPGSGPMRPRIGGPRGVVARLRSRPVIAGRPPLRFRYILWHDPDAMIESDPDLFGRVADAIAGVAAESEYASDDLLLLTRAIYVGGESLAAYAARVDGQFRAWRDDGAGEPFWRVVSGLDEPPVIASDLDVLLESPSQIAQNAMLASLEALAY
ncbi:MAG TPA: hypothetical protein ENJ00_00590 [Phycisphaerales bacterium]|nr:hypothetical protein [Phycisphaerales bacterium]